MAPLLAHDQKADAVPPYAATLSLDLQNRLNTAIVRWAESYSPYGAPLWGGGLEGRLKGVVGESAVAGSNLVRSPDAWACNDNNELVIHDRVLEIRPGAYLECSSSVAPNLTIRFEYGAFRLRGDWIEIRTGTLVYIFQHPGRGVPYVFKHGLWAGVGRGKDFQLVSTDVYPFGGFLILTNKEKYALRNIKLEITSDKGHQYWLRIPGLAPSMDVNLDLGNFKDGAGAPFDSKIARITLFCEINGRMGRAGWDWKVPVEP
jgi:hypothetical protein